MKATKRINSRISMKAWIASCIALVLLLGLVGCSDNSMLSKVKKTLSSQSASLVLTYREQEFDGEKDSFLSLLKNISGKEVPASTTGGLVAFQLQDSESGSVYLIDVYDSVLSVDDQSKRSSFSISEEEKLGFLSYQEVLVYGEDATELQRVVQDMKHSNPSLELELDAVTKFPVKMDEMVSMLASIDGSEVLGKANAREFGWELLVGSEKEAIRISVSEQEIQVLRNHQYVHYPLSEDAYQYLIHMADEIVHQNSLGEYMDLVGEGLEAPGFLSVELRERYQRAAAMYFYFNLSSIPANYFSNVTICHYDPDDPYNNCYLRSVDSRFQTYQQLESALLELYTSELTKQLLGNEMNRNFDGTLYVLGGSGRGSIESLTSVSFEPLRQSADLIEFNLVGHYENQEGKTLKKFPIVLKKTVVGWRFATFASAA